MVGVWVDVPASAKIEHAPVAVALAIDTSGSMAGDKIVHARKAARAVVDGLADGDMISIVAFDSEARHLLQLTRLDERTRKRVNATLAELDARGNTALFEGVKLAEMSLLHAPDTHLVRRAIVVSDGQATVGPSDPHELGRLAEVGMDHGVQVTALGVGLDYDETTLDAFAQRSSGRFYHLEYSKSLVGIVDDEMKLLATTAAAVAEIEIVPASGVTVLGVDAVRSTQDRASVRVPLGAMFAGQHRELLVRVRVDERVDERRALASLRLHFRDPGKDGVARVHEQIVEASLTNDARLVAAHEDERTQSIIALREAALLTASASQRANSGELAMAETDLERAEQALRQRATRSKNQAEQKRMKSSADQLQRTRSRVTAAKKAPPAKRKAAERAAALDANDVNMAFDGF
jgi:Ca-activated chloride channel family protein